MPELYAGPTQEFVERTMQNRIARDLKDAFFAFHGFNPSPSEERSWSNSLRALANTLTLGGFTDHGILLEYQLPLSSRRLDAMVTGHGHDGAPAAVIVELKQWTDCEPSTVDECVTVRYGGRAKAVLHPSAQARQYRDRLADGHTAFHDDAIRLDACAFLNDFMHDPRSELLADRHAHLLGSYPLFPGDRVQDLVDFMGERLAGGRGTEVLRSIRDGHRGEGLINVSTWAGGAERALLLPHLPDLWDDHIDSALRRAHVIIPAVRRTPDEETALPVPDVDPPLSESTGRRGFSLEDLPF